MGHWPNKALRFAISSVTREFESCAEVRGKGGMNVWNSFAPRSHKSPRLYAVYIGYSVDSLILSDLADSKWKLVNATSTFPPSALAYNVATGDKGCSSLPSPKTAVNQSFTKSSREWDCASTCPTSSTTTLVWFRPLRYLFMALSRLTFNRGSAQTRTGTTAYCFSTSRALSLSNNPNCWQVNLYAEVEIKVNTFYQAGPK